MNSEVLKQIKPNQILAILSYHPDQETQDALGLVLVQFYTENKNMKDLALLAGNKIASEKVRATAGLAAAKMLAEARNTKELLQLSANNEVPENVRQASKKHFAALALKKVENQIKKSEHFQLCYSAKEKDYPETTRELAGMHALKIFLGKNDSSTILKIAGDESFPQKVRDSAAALVEKAALREVKDAIRKGYLTYLSNLSKNLLYSEKIRQAALNALETTGQDVITKAAARSDTNRLLKISESDVIPEKIKEAAGLALVVLYARRANLDSLSHIQKNEKEYSPAIRTAAKRYVEQIILRNVEMYAEKGDLSALMELFESKSTPANIRMAAKNNFGKAAAKLVELRCLDGEELIELSKSKNLPEKMAEAVGLKGVKALIRKRNFRQLEGILEIGNYPAAIKAAGAFGLVEVYRREKDLTRLVLLSRDEKKSDEVRAAAVKAIGKLTNRLVNSYVEQRNYSELVSLANADYPEIVHEKAKEGLLLGAFETANRLCVSGVLPNDFKADYKQVLREIRKRTKPSTPKKCGEPQKLKK
ncbi:MAG: hypothetical protein V1492_04600 [Candidatus Micrarchaeota archaeon]